MRIAIIGCGKMGGWIAGKLSAEHEIAVYDLDSSKAGRIANAKHLRGLAELTDFKPELLINAVSLQHTLDAFGEVAMHLPPECVICDLASIKGKLPEYYKECGFRFVSVHPMFGPTFATMDSLREENAIVIKESDKAIAEFFEKFFGSLGVKVHHYTFAEHDRMMAYSLTTPFVTSLVFASSVDDTVVPGTTFARHRKIAKGLLSEDDWLLCEVLFNPESLPQLGRITAKLEYLKHIIKGKDYEEARKFLAKLRKNMGE